VIPSLREVALCSVDSVACPYCHEAIRLTAEELAAGRGFCALCGARFDVSGDVVGHGPLRSFQLPRTSRRALVMPQRFATCPECNRAARLSQNELRSKRSYCAACESEFDLLPELLLPNLHVGFVASVIAGKEPPDPRRVAEAVVAGVAAYRIERRTSRWLAALVLIPVLLLAAATTLIAKLVARTAGAWILITVALVCAVVVLAIVDGWLFDSEEITLSRHRLVQRRRTFFGIKRTKWWPTSLIRAFSFAPGGTAYLVAHPRQHWQMSAGSLEVIVDGARETIRLASVLGQTDASLAWLCRRLERTLREVRNSAP
jgi:hypothetical protein